MTKPNGWEQDFDEEFVVVSFPNRWNQSMVTIPGNEQIERLKTFISQAILSAEEAKVREIKSKLPYIYALGFENADRNMIRNKALQECHDVVDSFLSLPDQEQLTSKGKK